ncbi:MAG: glycerol-3-phosphate 1-O-acyltransferase PlsY [Puniceicoccaceae bacterium]
MSAWIAYAIVIAAGYLVGSVSFAVLLCKAKGIDIFTIGSGNPGATNVLRALGKPYGYACFALDALKGVATVFIGYGVASQAGMDPQPLGIAGLFAAILGHSFSVFLKFRGGKGVATTIGGLFALMPQVIVVAAVVWLIVFFIWRYVSLASIVLAGSLPLGAWYFNYDRLGLALCSVLAVLIIVRHRSNIQRLIAGTENRAGGKKE